MSLHEPVLAADVVSLLAPSRGGTFVDCTVGLGGHARALLEAGATRLVGIDRDAEALELAGEALAPWRDRLELVHADYRSLRSILTDRGLGEVAGIVADLGLSSFQLAGNGRGFSFQQDDPLDMRMDRRAGSTLGERLAGTNEAELADVIYRFGEERHSRRIARAIVRGVVAGEITTTRQLASVVRRAMPPRGRSRIDPATRTFQALRIWTNGELDGLDRFVTDAVASLGPGGRLAIVAFHSLEDRIVKHAFRALGQDDETGLTVLTRKPVVAGEAEVSANPRSRSARLRAIERRA